jgi:lysozyme family protein
MNLTGLGFAMIKVFWGPEIKKDYAQLWQRCIPSALGMKYGNQIASKIRSNKFRYDQIEKLTKVPWWFVGCLHQMEASLSFAKHLHNGDPLTARTKQVPAGRPVLGNPPFSWETSAIDAIKLKKLDQVTDWSIEHVLYLIEGFNGYGYRQYHPTVKTPYIWSMTNNYTKGKYVADNKYNPEAVSQQCGVACFLKALDIFTPTGELKK